MPGARLLNSDPESALSGEGLTREAAIADLTAGLGLLIEETGVPDELTITPVPPEADSPMPPRRIDYYDDPGAPKASSLVPSVNVVVINDAGDILMIRRTDNGNWAVPGGAIDLGESVTQARPARRARRPASNARSPASPASTQTPGT